MHKRARSISWKSLKKSLRSGFLVADASQCNGKTDGCCSASHMTPEKHIRQSILQLSLLRRSFCSLQARQKGLCRNVRLATLSKSTLVQPDSSMLALTICVTALGTGWPSLSRCTAWRKSWGMTHWIRPGCTLKEPGAIYNKLLRRSRGRKGKADPASKQEVTDAKGCRRATRQLPAATLAGRRWPGLRLPGRARLPQEPGGPQSPSRCAHRGGANGLFAGSADPGPPDPSSYRARARFCRPGWPALSGHGVCSSWHAAAEAPQGNATLARRDPVLREASGLGLAVYS